MRHNTQPGRERKRPERCVQYMYNTHMNSENIAVVDFICCARLSTASLSCARLLYSFFSVSFILFRRNQLQHTHYSSINFFAYIFIFFFLLLLLCVLLSVFSFIRGDTVLAVDVFVFFSLLFFLSFLLFWLVRCTFMHFFYRNFSSKNPKTRTNKVMNNKNW